MLAQVTAPRSQFVSWLVLYLLYCVLVSMSIANTKCNNQLPPDARTPIPPSPPVECEGYLAPHTTFLEWAVYFYGLSFCRAPPPPPPARRDPPYGALFPSAPRLLVAFSCPRGRSCSAVGASRA